MLLSPPPVVRNVGMFRRASVLTILLAAFLSGLRAETPANAEKVQVLKLVVISELHSAGYNVRERVCFSTREKPAVEKRIVSALRSLKLSIVELPLCAKRLTRSSIDIESIALDGSSATINVSTSDWDYPNGVHFFVYLRKGTYKLVKAKDGSWHIDSYSNLLKDGPQKVPTDYKS
jgi:hypothetical protein